jgi:hypothetical protein
MIEGGSNRPCGTILAISLLINAKLPQGVGLNLLVTFGTSLALL